MKAARAHHGPHIASLLGLLATSAMAGTWMACSSSETAQNEPDAGAASDGMLNIEAGCLRGDYRCEGNVAKKCDGLGGYAESVDCSTTGGSCQEPYGCHVCTEGTGSCEGGKAKVCLAHGTRYFEFDCDPDQGMRCDSDGCKGKCSPAELIPGYYGCDYVPTMTLNPVWSGFPFAVVISNTTDQNANVKVTRGQTVVTTDVVPANGVKTITLDWVADLKGGDQNACQEPPDPGGTRLVPGGAYRVRTDVPVTVYQFSPLQYQIAPVPEGCPVGADCPGSASGWTDCLSFSNDASLLLPLTALTGNYAVVSWPSTGNGTGFAAITALQDGTTVEVLGKGAFYPGAGIDAAGRGTVTLNAGDVLELVAAYTVARDSYGADISGTRVFASKPVQVIAGHSCANIPTATTLACDHLEDVMIPIQSLGMDYLVTYPAALASKSPHVVRIYAAEAATTLRFDPPSVHADVQLTPDDPPLEISGIMQDFRVSADRALLVTQYMQGQASVESGSGDPSLAVAVPTQQFRSTYIFAAPDTFDASFVNIIAPVGTSVRVDQTPVSLPQFEAIGGSGYAVLRHELSRQQIHRVDADKPVGVMVYGYGRYTSYMYPGGLDLRPITPTPVH